MSTTIEAVHEYDHDVDTVYSQFTDPDFYLAKFEGVGARNVEIVASNNEDGVFTVETSREVPLEVPGALKSLLGGWTTIIQAEEWTEEGEGEYVNQLDISSDGVPAAMSGMMRLYATDSGCVNEVAITIDCSIPLIGGKLERFVGATTADQLEEEYAFVQAWLEEI
jgi:hypothetical protein